MFLERGKLKKMFIKHTYTKTFGIYNGGLGVANGFVVARFFVSGNHSKDKSAKIERLELLKKPLELKDFKTSIQKKSGSLKKIASLENCIFERK